MADPRRFRGVRLSPQGDAYINLVATRDRITWSEALRRLLALGAKADMETHLDANSRRPPVSSRRGAEPGDQRETDHDDRDRHGDSGSAGVPDVPDRRPDPNPDTDPDASGSLGDALGHLIHAGFRPENLDPPGAA